MINLILFGPPGSGKGTQASQLITKYNLVHISTGDLFRSELQNQTELGKLAKTFMDKGELVPDSVTIDMFRKKISENTEANGFIFDGFPRTIDQANALDAFLQEMKEEVLLLLELEVPDDEVVRRIMLRGKASGRADDQNEDIIRNRLHSYRAYTAVVASHYALQGKTVVINGVGAIPEVFTRLCDNIDRAV